jgi:hypothetical protein
MKRKQRSIAPISDQQATIRRLTRRHFLGTGLVAGIGAAVLTPRIGFSLRAREAEALIGQPQAGFYKGMCYQPFPAPYTPSNANTTCIFFGSDIAYDCMEPLWGESFQSMSGVTYNGRKDLQKLKDMGVNLIRLYDWDPRNHHTKFLNRCSELGIKVLAPVSDYFLTPGQGYEQRRMQIPNLLASFSNTGNESGNDYHPAIAGIIMGNEPRIPDPNPFGVEQLSQFTKDWVLLERFPTKPKIGHPQDFGLHGQTYPAWDFWTTLLDAQHLGRLRDRLFLAIQPQNPARDLFVHFTGSDHGYVDATYAQFGLPLLFTEIGRSRLAPDPPHSYLDVVNGQLEGSIAYAAAHPEQLLGICYFQFADKVWKCPTRSCNDSEGSFGAFSHNPNRVLETVNYVPSDFTHTDEMAHYNCNNQQLKIDDLVENPTYAKIVANYTGRGR